MIHWDIAKVLECTHTRSGLQKIKVELRDGAICKAIHYTDVLPSVHQGDQVLLNTTAVDLSLGTGGYHFVHSILSHADGSILEGAEVHHKGHLMKLRYTPQQRSVLAAEEPASPYHELFNASENLYKTPVLIGELHSMLPILMCWFQYLMQQNMGPMYVDAQKKRPRIVYIMSDGGALPLAFSDHIAALNELGWLAGTITYGQAYGGDIETMNKFTALIAAKHILKADLVIVLMGPGIAGTGTMLGHTGVETGELVNAVSILGGIPVAIPRICFVDERQRHQGLSHHTLISLGTIAIKEAVIPLPHNLSGEKKHMLNQQLHESSCNHKHEIKWVSSIELSEIERSLQLYPYPITTMRKGLSEDPDFFLGVCSAAQAAWNGYIDEL